MDAPLTRWDADGLVVGDAPLPYLAGAMHYWRHDPRDWPACLRALAGLGLKIVESYVPWSEHEAHGWSGAHDLDGFLDAAADAGLAVILRPGPHCNAELTGFGYPERILRDDAMLARTAHGTPVWFPSPPRAFPVPSYASAEFRAEVARWYAQVAEIVAPRLAPHGPVVALAVDNEAQMFFRLGAYDHDYHPEALAWFGGEAPRKWDPADPERCAAWVRFKETYVARALGELTASLTAVGLGGVARFHNLPPGEPFWFDLPGVARAIGGPAGVDVYAGRRDLATVRRRALHLSGSSDIPIVPELGVGFAPWLPPIDPDDQRDVALAALAGGVRGVSFYMAVARERWYGAAIAADGTPGPAATWVRALTGALDEIGWPRVRRPADVAVVVSRTDARYGLASSLLDPLTPVVAEALGLGPGGAAELGRDDAAIGYRRWLAIVQDALDLAHVPYALVDESAPEKLAGYRAVIAPTFERLDHALADALADCEARKQVVVAGPGRPASLPRRAGLMRAESLTDLDGLAADLAAVSPPRESWISDQAQVTPLEQDGEVRALVLVNPGPRAVRAELRAPVREARDAFTGERVRLAAVPLAAHAARLLVL